MEDIKKWMVLKLDVLNNKIEIYNTFDCESEALLYLMNEVDAEEEFMKNNIWYKKIIEENAISIYELGWILKKQLIYRYFVKEY